MSGLAPAVEGNRHLDLQPHPGGGLTSARSQHLTPYGLAECAWTIEGEHIEVMVVVPPNATASVTLPKGNGTPIHVGSGTYRWVYPYHAPSHAPHSLDSTLDELIDDPETWNAVVRTIDQLHNIEPKIEAMIQSVINIQYCAPQPCA